jgi:hypothetical protein
LGKTKSCVKEFNNRALNKIITKVKYSISS